MSMGVSGWPSGEQLARAHRVLALAPLVDGHNDLPWALRELVGGDLSRYDVGVRQQRTHTDLVRAVEGGLAAQFWSVYVPSTLPAAEAVVATLEQVDLVRRLVAGYPHRLAAATTAADIRRAFAAGRIASLLGAEGGHSIGGSLGVLRALYALGVRYLTLTHNDNVAWADSATDEPRVGGLSDFGRQVVAEMNRLGMLVDLSHVSVATMQAALAASQAPVIFSHSSCRALVDHPRNVPDEVLARLARQGGVCMVAFVPPFVSADCCAWEQELGEHLRSRGMDPRDHRVRAAAAEEFAAHTPRPVATVRDVADHVEHVREVAGVEHVGIGGDFDGCDVLPEGLGDVSCYPALFAELLRRGWSEQDCFRLAGENVLRVLSDAEGVAATSRAVVAAAGAR